MLYGPNCWALKFTDSLVVELVRAGSKEKVDFGEHVGTWSNADGAWQYRAKENDLEGHGPNDSPHIHLERLDPSTGVVLENWHLRW